MLSFGRAWTMAAVVVLAVAAPTRRDVSSDDLKQLTLFAEYASASYCTNNINSTGDALSCAEGSCPTVQAAETKTLYEFNDSTEFGDVAGFLAADETNELLVLSFRGSRTVSTWVANLDFGLTDTKDLCKGCEAHGGFWKSWQTVADEMKSKIDAGLKSHPGYTVVLTGHSFGAAMATLGGTALRNDGYKVKLYTYGEPRVGNSALAKYITDQGDLYRVTHADDVVPKVPPASFGFSHASPEYWITSDSNKTVNPSDIKVVKGVGSRKGNAGTIKPDIEAHNWYIVNVDGCQ